MNLERPTVLEVATEMALPQSVFAQANKKFGPVITRAMAMATSVGGIGPLMRERIIAQTEQNINVIGVGLLYENVWMQRTNTLGNLFLERKQVGPYFRRLLKKTKWTFPLVLFTGEQVKVSVWEVDLGITKAYFLSCPEVTNVVYPGEIDAPEGMADTGYWAHIFRLKQFWLLGRGSLALAKKMNKKPDFIVLSETPTIFAIHRLFQDRLQKDPFFSKSKYIYNDHTPLEYAHPLWDAHTVKKLKIEPKYSLETRAWNSRTRHLDVTSMAVNVCDATFGVSKMHGATIRSMSSLRRYKTKIHVITNGVRKEDWQYPDFLLFEQKSDQELLQIKSKRRNLMIDWLKTCGELPKEWVKKMRSRKIVLFTRRITSYKRLDVLNDILSKPQFLRQFLKLNVFLLVAGRVHQQDEVAYHTATSLGKQIEKNPRLKSRLMFLRNFNVWEAPHLYQGADGAIMMSDKGQEASATGFMKSLLNGGTVIATTDGAVPEFVHFFRKGRTQTLQDSFNGFKIAYKNGRPTTESFLTCLKMFDTQLTRPKSHAVFIRAGLQKTRAVDIKRTASEMRHLYLCHLGFRGL